MPDAERKSQEAQDCHMILTDTDQNSSDTSETPETQTTLPSTQAQESDTSEAAVKQTEDHSGDTDVAPSENSLPEQPESAGTKVLKSKSSPSLF